ncbi:MAG TPA: FAD-dependent oxidoreductase [Anaerolineae bacterium]|nr:FAD-dependent oxidoreductase [Anaerolineae bacterium]
MSKSYDVLIVGGGIMGCATAFELADRGVKVALFEKKTVGEGPTGRSSAIIRQHYSNVLTARMAHYSLQVFRDFANRVGAGGECGFVEAGFLVLVEEKDHAGLEGNLALQQAVGIDTAMVSPQALRELLPRMDTHDLVAAAYEPHSGYADPYLTVTSYARAARERGTDLYQDTRVTVLRTERGKVLGVETDDGRFDAPQVINCTGAWAAGLAATAGIGLPIHSCRVQVAFFRRPPGHEAAHPVVADFGNAVYFRPETGNLTLIGLVDPAEANAIVHPDRYDERVDPEFIMDIGERLVRRYPAMEESQSTGGYSSLYAITPDWHPIVDEVPAGSGLYVCSGFSGHGFKLGPAVGLMVADLVTGASDPLFDPHLFRLDRFATGDVVRGQYEYSIAG